MKHYNKKFIREYIENHKEQIESVECFMREDWSWTCDTVFKDGEFCKGFDWKGKYLEVAGITGSTWATPTMEVEFKDGRTEIIECWIDDGDLFGQNYEQYLPLYKAMKDWLNSEVEE